MLYGCNYPFQIQHAVLELACGKCVINCFILGLICELFEGFIGDSRNPLAFVEVVCVLSMRVFKHALSLITHTVPWLTTQPHYVGQIFLCLLNRD